MSICAAAIYIASVITGDRRTKITISEVTGLTSLTVKNRVSELSEALKLNIN